MTITHLECSYFRGSSLRSEEASLVALNPSNFPGSLVMAGASALPGSLGSQVACRLALEQFVEGILEFFELSPEKFKSAANLEGEKIHSAKLATEKVATEIDSRPADEGTPRIESVAALEAAFRKANSSVYSFGHKLAAGGRLATSMFAMVVSEDHIATARVGEASCFLLREGELFPFFEEKPRASNSDQLVGSQSSVSLEVASVLLQEHDLVVAFSREPNRQALTQMSADIAGQKSEREDSSLCTRLCMRLFPDCDKLEYAFLTRFGPKTIYLTEEIESTAEIVQRL